MRTAIISLMWGTAWERYGKTFVESLDRYWPLETGLVVVSDKHRDLPRGRTVPLSSARGLEEFRTHWQSDRPANGFVEFRTKKDSRGYSWRHDAVKWAPQAFAPEVAIAELNDGDIACWLDADVVTFRHVAERLVEGLLGHHDLCHLGRRNAPSEIGFWAIRLSAATRAFCAAMAETYRSDAVFKLPEWHSAFVFDHCLAGLRKDGGTAKNLTPGGHGHVWFQCQPLCAVTDHLKGDRKIVGRSAERRE